jgi:phage terminase large subunit GpA-like protein
VWVPEGCTVDGEWAMECARAWKEPGGPHWQGWKNSPWVLGTPLRDGRDAGYQLSSLYALARTWGEIAEEWVGCQRNAQNLRNFINQWLAETWELASRKETWEKIGERLIDHGTPRGTVPVWASLLTCAVDRQGRDGGKFPWIVLAWGPGFRCHVVSYGECDTFDEIEAVLKTNFPHADGGNPLRIAYTLFDSGYRPDGVYEFCVRMIGQGFECWPAKGSNTALNSDFQWSTLGDNTSMPGMRLVIVDTIRSQLWLENRLFDVSEPKNTTIFAASVGDHQDFLEEVLNDAPVDQLDSRNNSRESWQRINESLPNDMRDVWRYAWEAMLIAQGGREPMPRRYQPPAKSNEPRQQGRIRELRIRR